MMMTFKVCAPTQLLVQISQKGLLLIPSVFIVLRERQGKKKIPVKQFSSCFIKKMDAQR